MLVLFDSCKKHCFMKVQIKPKPISNQQKNSNLLTVVANFNQIIDFMFYIGRLEFNFVVNDKNDFWNET